MISGIGQLRELSAYLRRLGAIVRGEGVARAAEAVGEVAAKQYERGAGPYDQAWKRNKDGKLSLRRPVKTIFWWGSGGAIRARAEDVLRYHMRATRNRPARPVFPANEQLPPPWARAAFDALERVLAARAPRP